MTDNAATDADSSVEASGPDDMDRLKNLHQQFGWWSLLAFLFLGIILETMHALRVGWLLDVGNDSRRLMWRLAHAHGTLLALVNVVFSLTMERMTAPPLAASRCLLAGSILLPLGFFAGGLFIYDGDPGMGVFLVPPGAVLLAVAVWLTARSVSRRK